jgi:hypothetical protein
MMNDEMNPCLVDPRHFLIRSPHLHTHQRTLGLYDDPRLRSEVKLGKTSPRVRESERREREEIHITYKNQQVLGPDRISYTPIHIRIRIYTYIHTYPLHTHIYTPPNTQTPSINIHPELTLTSTSTSTSTIFIIPKKNPLPSSWLRLRTRSHFSFSLPRLTHRYSASPNFVALSHSSPP